MKAGDAGKVERHGEIDHCFALGIILDLVHDRSDGTAWLGLRPSCPRQPLQHRSIVITRKQHPRQALLGPAKPEASQCSVEQRDLHAQLISPCRFLHQMADGPLRCLSDW